MKHRIALAQQPIVDSVGWTVGFEILSRFLTEEPQPRYATPDQVGDDIPWHAIDSLIAAYLPLVMQRLPGHEHIFVNISEKTWRDDYLFQSWVRQIARVNTLFRGRLIVEVSECMDISLIRQRWSAIRSTDVLLALDDYDNQHVSNGVLEALDWDFCKFNLHRLESLEDLAAIDYCRKQGIYSIVERIETPLESVMAKSAGVTLMQGFLYGRPVPSMRLPCHVPNVSITHTGAGDGL